MSKKEIISYNYFSRPPQRCVEFTHPSRTKTSEADSCDINKIVARYKRTGQLPPAKNGIFADVSNLTSYEQAVEIVDKVREHFEDMPAVIRRACDNNPGKFLDLVTNPRRRAEAEQLGIFKPRAKPEAPPGGSQEAKKSEEVKK